MKTKKFSKKLELNKNTIANLGNNEMDIIKGGEGDSHRITVCEKTICICPTTYTKCP